jgi:hypothetical protein
MIGTPVIPSINRKAAQQCAAFLHLLPDPAFALPRAQRCPPQPGAPPRLAPPLRFFAPRK